jgi:hypothetical protein
VARESDSPAFEKHLELAASWKWSAVESDSPAGRADRGLSDLGASESSREIFFTCHARWQGSSQTMSCAHWFDKLPHMRSQIEISRSARYDLALSGLIRESRRLMAIPPRTLVRIPPTRKSRYPTVVDEWQIPKQCRNRRIRRDPTPRSATPAVPPFLRVEKTRRDLRSRCSSLGRLWRLRKLQPHRKGH